MAVYFRGKVCSWEIQKTIHLSFLARAIVCRSRCLFCRLIVLFCLLVWDPGGRQGNTEQIFDRLRCPVASIEALSTTHWAMRSLPYRRIALVIKMASKRDAFVLIVFFACLYGTLAVAGEIRSKYSTNCGVQWLKLKTTHRSMRLVPYRRIALAIKMASE